MTVLHEVRPDAGAENLSGWVFNIQRFSLHDGPGIRTVVFLKGCPLVCDWCSNPESQQKTPQLMYKEHLCVGLENCGLCKTSCKQGALSFDRDGKVAIDWSLCNHCGDCTVVCPVNALEIAGRRMTVKEIVDEVEKDESFYSRSGGGITVSGGEPAMQAEFVNRLLSQCRKRLIDTAIETSGFGSWKNMSKTAEHADLVHFDIKSVNPEKHKTHTGVAVGPILDNILRLAKQFPDKPIVVRTPVIPGFNDTEEDIRDILEFLKQIGTVRDYQLLPYHRFGVSKYKYIGMECPIADLEIPDSEKMTHLQELARRHFDGAKMNLPP